MKSPRFVLPLVLLFLSPVAFGQSDMHDHKAVDNPAPKADAPKPAPTAAQKSFTEMKTLAGDWEGPVTLEPPHPEMSNGKPVHVTLRVTSRGNALVHEMQESGTPMDPTKYDHPLTMLYLDGDRLTLVHYCDAGNRPRMVARTSPDGKTVEFDFVDLSGGTKYGYMHHAVFTAIDANHHLEDWTYMMPGDKPMHAHFDLHRTQGGSVTSGQ
jgi:hypothetical protein